MNKRGIELASSILVILIVSVLLFGLASTITYRILCSSEEKIASYTQQQRDALERRLATGASVVVADASKTTEQSSSICGGARSSGAEFLIGVRNDGVAEDKFTATCDGVQLERDGQLVDSSTLCGTVQTLQELPLQVGERGSLPVVINVPRTADPGRYIYAINVQSDSVDRTVNLYLLVE
jgi:hypothetical protein